MIDLPNECQCDGEGPVRCELMRRKIDLEHGREMSETRHKECKHKPHYFQMFLAESIAGGNRKKFRRHRGLGDSVAWLIEKIGFKKKCQRCKKRQSWLNAILPYSWFWSAWDYFRRLKIIS